MLEPLDDQYLARTALAGCDCPITVPRLPLWWQSPRAPASGFRYRNPAVTGTTDRCSNQILPRKQTYHRDDSDARGHLRRIDRSRYPRRKSDPDRDHVRAISVADLVVLDAVHRGLDIPEPIADRLTDLIALGAVERLDRTRLVLSKSFYVIQGKPGEYTRRAGLDRETRKELLLRHIAGSAEAGAPFEELSQVLPQASRNELKVLLRELKDAGRAHVKGATRSARWHAGKEAGND